MLPRSRLIDLWDRAKSSYWFVPSIMFLGALGLAMGTLAADVFLERSNGTGASLWFPRFEGEGARSILSTIASGMVTVTGIVFSLTVVALQLASSQFGPRLLRAFMKSKGTQISLGTFTATFAYCLMVVGTVRESIGFVPQLSTATGILLGIIGVAVLIYFIHHLSNSIRIETVIAVVNADLRAVIDVLFPSEIGEEPDQTPPHEERVVPANEAARGVFATSAGYVRQINSDMLMSVAKEHDLLLRVEQKPGSFAVEGSRLVSGWPDERVPDDVAQRIRHSIVLGEDRTTNQDVSFALRQLVELALRALSPGINDPFTAIECINRLDEALCTVVRRRRPSTFRHDEDGRLRVIAEPMSLADMATTSFNAIARAGGSNGDVAMHLLGAVLNIASFADSNADAQWLLDYAGELHRQMEEQMELERDRRSVSERFHLALDGVRRRLETSDAASEGMPPLTLSGDVV